MPDATTLGLLGIAGSLLGSLNRGSPKDNFEAAKIFDENDPIRKTLELYLTGVPKNTSIILADGKMYALREIRELGYGAAILKIVFSSFGPTTNMAVISIRYSAISAIIQMADRFSLPNH